MISMMSKGKCRKWLGQRKKKKLETRYLDQGMEFGFDPKWIGKASEVLNKEGRMVLTHSKIAFAFEYRLDLGVARIEGEKPVKKIIVTRSRLDGLD